MKLFLLPDSHEWILFASIFVAISLFIVLAEALRKHFNRSAEITRKLVHILTGVLIFFAPQLFQSGIPAIALAVIFILVNFGAIRFGLLQGIHGTNRISYGTVYYPVSFLILVLLFWDSAPYIISTSILVLAFGDAAAAIVGENITTPHTFYLTSDKKSVEGSVTMFFVSALTVFVSLQYLSAGISGASALSISIASALFVTAWEALSSRGFDNLTVPMSAAFVIHFLTVTHSSESGTSLYVGLFLGMVIAGISYYYKFLTHSGSVATFLLATIIYGLGGWVWTIPIVTFFIASSIVSKLRENKRKDLSAVFEKTDRRDEGQVAANGGVAGLLILLWYIFPDKTFLYELYLASLSAVVADTWSTETGTLGKRKPRSIITGKTVPHGTSGGVSSIGFLGGIVGSFLVIGSAWLIAPDVVTAGVFTKLLIAGTIGSIVDSLLGAMVQSKYKTSQGIVTERPVTDTVQNTLIQGYRWIDNDIVNWGCAVAGAVSMYVML